MSMSFGEAMSCGLPVLVKEDYENIAYSMVKEGVNGFVYKNREEFANYLKTFSKFDMNEKSNIRKTVRNTIPKNSYISMAEEYTKLYESLIKKK